MPFQLNTGVSTVSMTVRIPTPPLLLPLFVSLHQQLELSIDLLSLIYLRGRSAAFTSYPSVFLFPRVFFAPPPSTLSRCLLSKMCQLTGNSVSSIPPPRGFLILRFEWSPRFNVGRESPIMANHSGTQGCATSRRSSPCFTSSPMTHHFQSTRRTKRVHSSRLRHDQLARALSILPAPLSRLFTYIFHPGKFGVPASLWLRGPSSQLYILLAARSMAGDARSLRRDARRE